MAVVPPPCLEDSGKRQAKLGQAAYYERINAVSYLAVTLPGLYSSP